jgi:uncharacterized protein (DUF1778 family)
MKESSSKKERITVRLNPNQMQVLRELTAGLNTSYSMLVRTIISDFITKNEDVLERITVKHLDENADN